jgi:hypothetical protein
MITASHPLTTHGDAVAAVAGDVLRLLTVVDVEAQEGPSMWPRRTRCTSPPLPG